VRRAKLLSWIVVASLLASGCGSSTGDAPSGSSSSESNGDSRPSPVAHGEGHRKMLALLREIAARTDEEHAYLGDGYARQLREKLKRLAPNVDPRDRWDTERRLGTAELRLGNVEAAIGHLQRAYDLLPQARLGVRWETTTRFDLGVA
jgi:tetratricopeptide (TPR) repeat protein